MRATVRLALLLLLSLSLSACGFQLRGDYRVAGHLLPLYLEVAQDTALRDELRLQLAANDIATTETAGEAASRLRVDNVRRARRVLSVDSRGRAREYQLEYSMRLQLERLSGQQQDAASLRELRLERELLFDPDSVLAVGYEIETLYRDMQQDAARLILRQLQAVK